jgi:hypothetical protein
MNSEIKFYNICMYLFLDAGSVGSATSVLSLASLTSGIKRNVKVSTKKNKPDGAIYNTLLHKRLRKYES